MLRRRVRAPHLQQHWVSADSSRVNEGKRVSRLDRAIAVIGLGSFGGSVAEELSRVGDHVLGIDLLESRVARYSNILHRAVIADARDERALDDIGLGEYDIVVVAMGTDLESSLLACMNARHAGVDDVWAKAGSETHARILERIGVDRVMQPENEYGKHLAQRLHNPAMLDYLGLDDSLRLASIRCNDGRTGQSLDQIKPLKRHDMHCLGVLRQGSVAAADAALVLEPGDVLLVVGTREHLRAFAEHF